MIYSAHCAPHKFTVYKSCKFVIITEKGGNNTKNINVNVQRPPTNIPLGRQGENLATCVIFDCTGLVQLYGDGTAELLHELKSGTVYPVAIKQDGTSVSWIVTASDTANIGSGRAELRWYVGDTLAKSAKFRTSVSSALADSTTETPPEPQKSWVDKVLAAAQEIKDGAISDEKLAAAIAAYLEDHPIDAGLDEAALAAYLVENGYLTDAALADAITQALADAKASGQFDGEPGKDGVDGKDGTQGVDGYTPVKGVDYGTPEEIAEIAQSAAEVLQPEVSQIKDDLSAEQTAREQADTSLQKEISGKLPKSPADWEAWTAEQQAAARERMGIDKFEEIAIITLAEDSTPIIDLGAEYEKLFIVFEIPAGDTCISNNKIRNQNKMPIGFFPSHTVFTNSVKFATCIISKYGDYWTCDINHGANNSASSAGSNRSAFKVSDDIVTKLNFINPIRTGSKISVYGVRVS